MTESLHHINITTTNICPEDMVYIPGGSFIRGAENNDPDEVPHEVQLPAYCLLDHEVTNDEYHSIFPDAPLTPDERFLKPRQPKVFINWYDAQAYCEAKGWRLPTEAQFERAAKGTEGGNKFATISGELTHDEACYTERGERITAPTAGVFDYLPNNFGVFGLTGNAAEWSLDWYYRYPDRLDTQDPAGPEQSTGFKTVRGGHWRMNDPEDLRVTNRVFYRPEETRELFIGFRCAVEPKF